MIWFVFEQSLSYLLMIPRNNFFRWNVISNMFLALFSRQNLTRVQLKHNCIYVHVPLCSYFGNRFPKTCLFAGYSWCTDTPSKLYWDVLALAKCTKIHYRSCILIHVNCQPTSNNLGDDTVFFCEGARRLLAGMFTSDRCRIKQSSF